MIRKHTTNTNPLTGFGKDRLLLMHEDGEEGQTIYDTYNANVKFRSLVKGLERPKRHRFLWFGSPKPTFFYEIPEFPDGC